MLTHTPSGLWAVVPLMLFDWLALRYALRRRPAPSRPVPAPRSSHRCRHARLASTVNLLFPAFR